MFQLLLCSLTDAASSWSVSSIPSSFHLLIWGFCFRMCYSSTYAASWMLPAHEMFLQFHPPSICSCEDFVLVCVPALPMQPPRCCQLMICFFNSILLPSAHVKILLEDVSQLHLCSIPDAASSWYFSSIPSAFHLLMLGFCFRTCSNSNNAASQMLPAHEYVSSIPSSFYLLMWRFCFRTWLQLHLCSLTEAASSWYDSSIPSSFYLLMWGFCFRTCSSSTYAATRMLPVHDMFLQFHPPSIRSCEDFVLGHVTAPPMQPPGCWQLMICFFNSILLPSAHVWFHWRTCPSFTYAASRMLPAQDFFLQYHLPPSAPGFCFRMCSSSTYAASRWLVSSIPSSSQLFKWGSSYFVVKHFLHTPTCCQDSFIGGPGPAPSCSLPGSSMLLRRVPPDNQDYRWIWCKTAWVPLAGKSKNKPHTFNF